MASLAQGTGQIRAMKQMSKKEMVFKNQVGQGRHKVVPQFGIAKLVNITPMKPMVYGRYNELVNGVYKPTYNWGAPSCRAARNCDGEGKFPKNQVFDGRWDSKT